MQEGISSNLMSALFFLQFRRLCAGHTYLIKSIVITFGSMKCQKITPPPMLRSYVQYFWTLDSDDDESGSTTFTTIADGLPGLIFQQFDSGEQTAFDLPTCYLYGQSVKPIQIMMPSRFRAIGVYFYPHALQAVFGLPAHEWTNNCVGLDVLDGVEGKALEECLLNTLGTDERVAILASYLYKRTLRNNLNKQDAEAVYAVKQIRQANGHLGLQALQADLRISERSLERKFREAIGVGPKLFSRICQFQGALEQIRTGHFANLTDVAFSHGYADQSHFIRSFKAFVGFSPKQYKQAVMEQLPNFPQRIG